MPPPNDAAAVPVLLVCIVNTSCTVFVFAVTFVIVTAPPVVVAPVIAIRVTPAVSRFNPKSSFVPIVTAAPVVLPPFVMSPAPADGVKYSRAVSPALTRNCCNAVPNDVNPVPPFATAISVPLQAPAAIVPTVVMFVVPAHVERAVFSTLFKERTVFVVAALSTSGAPVPAVSRPKKESVAMSAILASVTALFAIVAAKLPVPLPVTSPVSVIVWSPVFVPLTVAVADAVNVAPSAMVSVADVAGAVMATLLTDVAAATPKMGVTNVGVVARTGAPLPVAVVHTGNALAPPPTNISVVAPAASV